MLVNVTLNLCKLSTLLEYNEYIEHKPCIIV